MSVKRLGSLTLGSQLKRRKSTESLSYFHKTLQECGLILKPPPDKCEVSQETVYIVRSLTKSLSNHADYPYNVEKFITDFVNACKDNKVFEHYLYFNIVRAGGDEAMCINDSVIKILLNVTFIQNKIVDYIFDKVVDFLNKQEFEAWVKMILKTLSELNAIANSDNLSTQLIDLLDVSTNKAVRLEIISAIPNIIGDQEHDNVATKMRRILSENISEDRYLIPSILDCLSFLCLSDSQFEDLQKVTLKQLHPSNAAYFSNFVKFLLTPGRLGESAYEETIKGLRRELGWSSLINSQEDLATSQVLTATAIRSSMVSSKAIDKAWLKVISSCQLDTDHKPIDIVFFLIYFSISDEKQKQVETIIRKEIKLQIFTEELLNEAFKMFKPILKHNLAHLISLANALLKVSIEPLCQTFASYMYMVMFSELPDCCPTLVAELLQLVLNNKQSVLIALNILNNIASKNLSLLKSQSLSILTLMDRMDDMTLTEVKAVMNLVCGLAFSFDNLGIRDEVHMIISKELGSSIRSIKFQGILAGIHAVKYLTRGSNDKDVNLLDDEADVTSFSSMTLHLPEGDLREAGQIMERINHSTMHFPDMMAFFYDELYNIIEQATDMKKTFVGWLTIVLTNDLQENFLVDKLDNDTFGEIKVSTQLCLNHESEINDELFINIAGIILEERNDVNIEILSPLFQLVRVLHYKRDGGDLSSIDALLGFSIVMPNVDIDIIENLSEYSVTKILDCYVHCVNWIRELLNAFASQQDNVLKPKILLRVQQLIELEKTIENILLKTSITYIASSYNYAITQAVHVGHAKEQVRKAQVLKSQAGKQKKGKKPDKDDATQSVSKSQQTQMDAPIKNKFAATHNIYFRPLNLILINLLRYDLSPQDKSTDELTFESLSYLLNHLNSSLEKILVPKLKRKTFLSKDSVDIYNRSDAVTQAQTISEILPKVIDHVDVVTSYLECHLIEDHELGFDSLFTTRIMESCQCLEHLYHLLTIYFRWMEFKNSHVGLLKSSLATVAREKDTSVSMDKMLLTVMNNFQKHEKYCITLSSAVALIEFIKALQEYSTQSGVTSILKGMAHKFLSKQWKSSDGQLEKGPLYNQGLDSLAKAFLANVEIIDLKDFVTNLVADVVELREKTSVLKTLKSINKSNFSILFRNLGIALCDKIKRHLNGGLTNEEHVKMWANVASIIKLMSDIISSLGNKNTASVFLKVSIPVLNLFLSKGFPILKIQFEEQHQLIIELLKDFQTSTNRLNNVCSLTGDKALVKKIPIMKGMLTDFSYRTKELLKSNNCLDAMDFNVANGNNSNRRSKTSKNQIYAPDETLEDCDNNLPDDDSDAIDEFQVNSIGISEMI